MAGLWEHWAGDAETGAITSCIINFSAANALIEAIHDRMPVIGSPAHNADSLAPANRDTAALIPRQRIGSSSLSAAE